MDGWGTEALSPTAASSTFPSLGHTAGFHRAGAQALPTHCLNLTELQLVIKHLGSFLNMKVKPTVGGDLGEGRTTLSGGGDVGWCLMVVAAEVAMNAGGDKGWGLRSRLWPLTKMLLASL